MTGKWPDPEWWSFRLLAPRRLYGGRFDSNADSNRSGEGILHGPCRLGRHAWHLVNVDVEGDGDGGVSEDFLHYLGVGALREQEARRRVPEVVETKGAGETGFIEQGLEGAGDEVVTLDGGTRGGAEHKIAIFPRVSYQAFLFVLHCLMTLEDTYCIRRKGHTVRRLFFVFGAVKRGPSLAGERVRFTESVSAS